MKPFAEITLQEYLYMRMRIRIVETFALMMFLTW